MIRDLYPWFAGGLVVAGLATQNAALAAIGFAVGIVCYGATLWSRWALSRLEYARILPEDHAFPGEDLEMTLRFTNKKPLPLTWLEVRDAFPEALVPAERTGSEGEFAPVGMPHVLGVDWRTSVAAYTRASKPLGLRAGARGLYRLGPATIRSGDPLGLFPDQRVDHTESRIIVYPRTAELPQVTIPSRRPYGEQKGGPRIFEDPARIAGLRDYQPGDPLRRVDWNATARVGRMQSRVYEPTTTHNLVVCLNTATMTPDWAGYIPELFERSITVAASIARQAHEQKYAVGLLATSTVVETLSAADQTQDMLRDVTREMEVRREVEAGRRDTSRVLGGSIRIMPARRTEQLVRVLEALALIGPFVLEPLSRLLDREEHRLPTGATLVVVTGVMPAELADTLLRLRQRRYPVLVLSTSGEAWGDLLPGIEVADCSGVDAGLEAGPMFSRPEVVDEDAETVP